MITEVKTNPKRPCCPFMSGQPVPIAPPPGRVLQPNQMAVAPMAVPCAEGQCPLYDSLFERCCVTEVLTVSRNLAALHDRVAELSQVLAPPKDAPSPLMRIAETLEATFKHQKDFWSLKKTRKG